LLAARKQNTTMVFLFKAGLAVALLAVLVYDVWLTFQSHMRLTLAGYAKVLDGDTLMVGHLLLPRHSKVFVAIPHTAELRSNANTCFFNTPN